MNHAERNHASQQIVSYCGEGDILRFTFADVFARVRRLANALKSLGIKHGEKVATMAWNDHRHLELYYAISCSGSICHTVNPRLFKEQIIYIMNHAEDVCIFLDPMFVPILESVESKLESTKLFVVLCDESDMPETSLSNVKCYETLLENESDEHTWPNLLEDTPSSLCYTSGTTGDPKGVMYTHRSNVLHSYACATPDAMNLSSLDAVLPVVPMFHANSWGLNYSLPMVGAKMVLPGSKSADPEMLATLMNAEGVTMTSGVPTVWLSLLNYLTDTNQSLPSLKRAIVGGSACPPSVIEEFRIKHEVDVVHVWGMTETSPLGTIFSPKPGYYDLPNEGQLELKMRQGRTPYGIEMKIVDDEGKELPWDGSSFGSLKVKGNWVADGYYKKEDDESVDAQGWFETGDVATIDENGYMNIVDRTKDVIKSGGEWISSIELENAALSHASVKEAAVIGVSHAKWGERPLLVLVMKEETGETDEFKKEILTFLADKVAKWWLPERIEYAKALPYTATGKISKMTLRQQYE